jgi:hypothetical protein
VCDTKERTVGLTVHVELMGFCFAASRGAPRNGRRTGEEYRRPGVILCDAFRFLAPRCAWLLGRQASCWVKYGRASGA